MKMVLGVAVADPINSAPCETWQQVLERGLNGPTRLHHDPAACVGLLDHASRGTDMRLVRLEHVQTQKSQT